MKRNRHPERLSTICAVVPCYNVASTCADVVKQLKKMVGRVIAVDDGSRDRTYRALASTRVRVIKHSENLGKGHAILSGFREALKDIHTEAIVTVDGDLQHDPDDVERIIRRLPCDLVVGNRFARPTRNQPFHRAISNITMNALLSVKLRRRIPDSQCGLRAYSRIFAEHLLNHSGGGRFEWETKALLLAVRRDFDVSFVPISMRYLQHEETSSFKMIWDTLRVASTLVR